jgi:hypothetical protein
LPALLTATDLRILRLRVRLALRRRLSLERLAALFCLAGFAETLLGAGVGGGLVVARLAAVLEPLVDLSGPAALAGALMPHLSLSSLGTLVVSALATLLLSTMGRLLLASLPAALRPALALGSSLLPASMLPSVALCSPGLLWLVRTLPLLT